MKPIVTIDEAKNIIADFHKKHKKVVLTGGCFDILHPGHFTLLENAKKEGDVLIVLLESDEKITLLKGKQRPIHSQDERASMLTSLRCVDYVIPLSFIAKDKSYDDLLLSLKPDVIATTQNDPHLAHKQRQASLIGAKIVEVTKYIPHKSTSNLISILSNEN